MVFKSSSKRVSINEKTGELTIEPTAKPGIFIIYAKIFSIRILKNHCL